MQQITKVYVYHDVTAGKKYQRQYFTIELSAAERTEAVTGLQVGEKVADAILAAAHVLRLLVAVPALKPTFKPLQPSFRH